MCGSGSSLPPNEIGKQLKLVNDTGQVLGKDRLRERIGESGQVFEAVGLYRRAVNDALFHLDDYRYSSLVNLLIQLRRPSVDAPSVRRRPCPER